MGVHQQAWCASQTSLSSYLPPPPCTPLKWCCFEWWMYTCSILPPPAVRSPPPVHRSLPCQCHRSPRDHRSGKQDCRRKEERCDITMAWFMSEGTHLWYVVSFLASFPGHMGGENFLSFHAASQYWPRSQYWPPSQYWPSSQY